MKIKALVAAVGLSLVAATSYAAVGDPVNISSNGTTALPTSVGSLDWATGNAQLVGLQTDPLTGAPIPGTTFQVYAHATLNAFQDTNGSKINSGCVNSGACEWTFVAGFRETVVASNGTTGQASFAIVPNAPENFFNIYYDPTPDSNNLAGTGFNDGTLILSGNATAGTSDFTRSTPLGGGAGGFPPLDSFNIDNYPGLLSVEGTGGTRLQGTVSFFDPAFFLTPPSVIALNFQSQQNLPYEQTNPSALFYNLLNAQLQTPPSVPGASIANLGVVNGATLAECLSIGITGPCGTGNVLFQTDASTSFRVARVPEPASLSLLGLGLALLGFAKRRAKS